MHECKYDDKIIEISEDVKSTKTDVKWIKKVLENNRGNLLWVGTTVIALIAIFK